VVGSETPGAGSSSLSGDGTDRGGGRTPSPETTEEETMRTFVLKDGRRFEAEDARGLFAAMHASSLWNRDRSLDDYVLDVADRAATLSGQVLALWTDEEALLDALIGIGQVEETTPGRRRGAVNCNGGSR